MNVPLSENMYRENILDLYKNPHNRGPLPNATHTYREFNPVCGDDIIIQMKIAKGKIEDIKFLGKGCAISIAAASLVTDYAKGKGVEKLIKLQQKDMADLLEIPISPARIKCATLALQGIQNALGGNHGTA